MEHPDSGRVLEIYSSQPGIHLYTPNFTCGSLVGKHGEAYSGRSGVCIENQNFPNAINMVRFSHLFCTANVVELEYGDVA